MWHHIAQCETSGFRMWHHTAQCETSGVRMWHHTAQCETSGVRNSATLPDFWSDDMATLSLSHYQTFGVTIWQA